MYPYLIKILSLVFSLAFFLGCQTLIHYDSFQISKKTTDYELCFPMKYMKMFDLPDQVRFEYLKDVQLEVDNRNLDCQARFEAYTINVLEDTPHVEETNLDEINKKAFNNRKCKLSKNNISTICN
jgi:hypothetical protein